MHTTQHNADKVHQQQDRGRRGDATNSKNTSYIALTSSLMVVGEQVGAYAIQWNECETTLKVLLNGHVFNSSTQ